MKRWIHAASDLNSVFDSSRWEDRKSYAYDATDPNELRKLANDPKAEVRLAVALNEYTPEDTLRKLSHDDSMYVRRNVAGNSSTPYDVLQELTEDSKGTVRKWAAQTLANVYSGSKSSERLPFRYVVYSYDLDSDNELDSLKGFKSDQLDAAIKFASRFANKSADEGLGSHVVIVPDSEEAEDLLYEEGINPYEIVWKSYEA